MFEVILRGPKHTIAVLGVVTLALGEAAGQSVFCHVTDGQFTICPDGSQEWADVTPVFFPESGVYLYADQADLDPELGTHYSPLDTFMLMYELTGQTD